MARLFISYSMKNSEYAIALRDWLVREGWSGPDDIFLDLDPDRGVAAGQRWTKALEEAETRCEAVLFLISREWLASRWCADEYLVANRLNKKLFALILDNTTLDELPGVLVAEWQIARLKGDPAERFVVTNPLTHVSFPVHLAEQGLKSLKRGLDKAGVAPETFELQPDANGPLGWRAPYRGLEALEAADAAVFFGRGADLMRGIDALRGLAARHAARLLVLLGASGAGKSSFLRAGLWPRLLRDDSQWMPLKVIRAGHDGAIEGSEGLLTALEDLHRRFALNASRANLRKRVATKDLFITLLHELRKAAARRALISEETLPLAVLCLDQGEEFFAADRDLESDCILELARAAIAAGEALLLMTIRSDAFGLMQSASEFVGLDPVLLSLGPLPQGEIANVIREPSEVLRRRAGPRAPRFDTAVIERLQAEIAGEMDALPLLAFVLQRLTREHAGMGTIGLAELELTGGVSAAIEAAAEAALRQANIGSDRSQQREALRRLFIPHLARVDPNSKLPQRRVTPQRQLPADLASLARALTQWRLLVVKKATKAEDRIDSTEPTLEVAHEALLRQWPMLTELLMEERDALLLLDGVLSAARDWEKADEADKTDFLLHRGSRLIDAVSLSARNAAWEHAIAPARTYIAQCVKRDAEERDDKERALARERDQVERTKRLQRRAYWSLAAILLIILGLGTLVYQERHNNLLLGSELSTRETLIGQQKIELEEQQQSQIHTEANFFGTVAGVERGNGDLNAALRLAILGTRRDLETRNTLKGSFAAAELVATATASRWQYELAKQDEEVIAANLTPDNSHLIVVTKRSVEKTDLATGDKHPLFEVGGRGFIRAATFSADGKRLFVSSWWREGNRHVDETEVYLAEIIDTSTEAETELDAWTHQAVFSPNGKSLLTIDDDEGRLFDSANGASARQFKLPGMQLLGIADDGETLTSIHDGKLATIDLKTNKTKASNIEVAGNDRVALSPNGLIAAVVSTEQQREEHVNLFDVQSSKLLRSLSGLPEVLSLSFNSEGSLLAAALGDQTVRVWDISPGNTETIIPIRKALGSVGFSPTENKIVVSAIDGTVKAISIDQALRVSNVKVPMQEEGHLLGFDGNLLLYASNDDLGVWNFATETWTKLAKINPDRSVACLMRGGRKAVVLTADNEVRVIDTVTGSTLATRPNEFGEYIRLGVTSDDRVTIAASSGMNVWDPVKNELKRVCTSCQANLGSAVSIDGTTAMTLSDSHNYLVQTWSLATKQSIDRFERPYISSASLFETNHPIIATIDQKVVQTWDGDSGKTLATILGDRYGVEQTTFSPDGLRVVTLGQDNAVHIWDSETGLEIVSLPFGRDYESGRQAFFSGDGQRLAVQDRYSTKIWNIATAVVSGQDLVHKLCASALPGVTRLTRNEMRLIGYSDEEPQIDACTGVPNSVRR